MCLMGARGQDVPQMCLSCNAEGTGCCLYLICHFETLHGCPLRLLTLYIKRSSFPVVLPLWCLVIRIK